MKTICINGSSLFGRITGIERYVYEVIKRLDGLLETSSLDIRLLVPKGVKINSPELKNIKMVELQAKGNKIRTSTIRKYLKVNNGLYCSLSGNTCIQKGALICTHDIRPWIFKQYDPLIFRMKCGFNFLSSKLLAGQIITDTEKSREEFNQYLKIKYDRITVIPLGWEHMLDVIEDESILERHPELVAKEYYYSLSSQAPHKNFKWVWENAKKNPDKKFAIAGKLWNGAGKVDELPDNVIYLGYITDGESKALMKHCKAFIHPSKYEGFGIPPLEALACGADIVVSDCSCLPEIFSTCATLIDPNDYNFNFEKVKKCEEKARKQVLKKYSWSTTADMWMALFDKYVQ